MNFSEDHALYTICAMLIALNLVSFNMPNMRGAVILVDWKMVTVKFKIWLFFTSYSSIVTTFWRIRS